MNEKKFEFLEHTADMKFKSYGNTLEECFENSALAFFTAMLGESEVAEEVKNEGFMEAENLDYLMHDFLSEFIFLFDVEHLVFKKFKVSITKNSKYCMKYSSYGEKFNPEKHRMESNIKAVTYHDLQVKKTKNKEKEFWEAAVLCDV